GRIVFGAGTLAQAGVAASQMGRQALVVCGAPETVTAVLLTHLHNHAVNAVPFPVSGEPTTDTIAAGVQAARDAGCDLVIGLGGGSAIDTAKAVAALLSNGGEPLDYLEVIGRGRPLTRPSAPTIAIPTTAGTGAEVTRNAVLASPEHRVKVSLRSPHMLPDLAIVDPELTYSLPPAVTASTGLDALTQVMEPFVSNKANPLTDGFCREGMALAARSLRRVMADGRDAAARTDMALASLLGGLALANAKLGAVHGFAGVLGGMYPAPHGIICARLLPYTMAANVRALQTRASDHPALARYDEIARILTGQPEAAAADGVAWVESLCADLAVPPLGEFGLTEEAFPQVVAQSQRASSMKGNPIPLTDAELTAILEQAV
ncbi:MAG: iron-containing alcohol dehydrogenase, partial [Anaerolineales bacterium]|nr:iron-containing alcohol dehydrogenase [Anaerolineales bacterium]